MNKPKIAKTAVRYATGFVTGTVVAATIRNAVPHHENKVVDIILSASCLVTGLAVTNMAHDGISEYTDRKIDEFVAQFYS